MPRRQRHSVVAASVMLAATACGGDGGRSAGMPTAAPTATSSTGTSEGAVATRPARTSASSMPTDPVASPELTGRRGAVTDGSTAPPEAGQTTDGGYATSDAGRRLRAADDGETIRLRVGETATLVQDDPLAADPTVDGDAIELVELVNVTGSGSRQWEVRAVTAGEAVIEAEDRPRGFVITVTVE